MEDQRVLRHAGTGGALPVGRGGDWMNLTSQVTQVSTMLLEEGRSISSNKYFVGFSKAYSTYVAVCLCVCILA